MQKQVLVIVATVYQEEAIYEEDCFFLFALGSLYLQGNKGVERESEVEGRERK